MYFTRNIASILLAALEYMPVVLLRGARQTGKTTLMQHVAKDLGYEYLSFDHIMLLATAKNDPVDFVERLQKPVILDEIQRVPELFLLLKSVIDRQRIPGRYLLTGSADPLLIPQMGDSLAGRMRLLTLWPLSQGEIEGQKETFLSAIFQKELPSIHKTNFSKQDLIERIVKGGYPIPLNLTQTQQRRGWFEDYLSLVLEKDVLDLARIEKLTQLPHLLALLAARIGGLLNMEEITRTLKLSTATAQRYRELLQRLFLVTFVPAWSDNQGKRLVKAPKIYLADTALALFLLNLEGDALITNPSLLGSLVENFVIMEITKQLTWHEERIMLYHYRDHQGKEVDIVLEGPGGKIVGLEIKSRSTVTKDDFKGLKHLQEILGDRFLQGIVLYSGDMHVPFGPNMTASPINSLWRS